MMTTTSKAQPVKGPRKHTTKRRAAGSAKSAGPPPLLRVAVYGTLRKHGLNHDRFCSGVLSIESVTLLGRLEWLSEFVPRLHVPEDIVLAEGTTDYEADVALQAEITARLRRGEGGPPEVRHRGAWEEVPAEILTFDDPRPRLFRIDHLEGFVPGQRSFYRRVLVPVISAAREAVWVYVG